MATTDDDKRFEAMLDLLDAHEPGLGAKLQDFIRNECKRIGVLRELSKVRVPKEIMLRARVNGVPWLLAAIYPTDGKVYFSLPGEPKDERPEEFNRYIDTCRALTGEGTPALQLKLLLRKPEQWAAAMEEFLNSIRNTRRRAPSQEAATK